ncbi:hypothetical protein MJH12_20360 [bacterium]|nr:hypothetical protein [bacterium]
MLIRIIVVYFLLGHQILMSSDDLFDDILLKEAGTYHSESRNPILTESTVEARVFESQLYFSIAEKAEIRLQKITQKIELMDQAITLPLAIASQYQKKQKELIKYKSELAHRIIKGYLNSKAQESPVKTPKDYGIKQALKVAKRLQGDQFIEFIGNWEASYTSYEAKSKFAPYLIMVEMYGIDHELSQKASNSLKAERERIYQFRETTYKAPREEEVEYIHDVIKDHKGIMSYPVKRSLDRVEKTKRLLRSSELTRERKSFLTDRLYREKEALISFLSRDGLEIFPSHSNQESTFEDRFKEWFEKRMTSKRVEHLNWPLKDEGIIVSKFSKRHKYITLRPEVYLKLLSPLNASVQIANKNEILISSKQFRIWIKGGFDLLSKAGDTVQAGDPIAILLDKETFQVHLESVIPGKKITYKTSDFLSYF